MKTEQPHYSGDLSKKFWRKVNKLKIESNRQECYSLGVALQNLETYVLTQLANARSSER